MHNGIQHKDSVVMLNVAENPSMLSIVMLNVAMLTVRENPSMLSIVMLSVMAPKKHFILPQHEIDFIAP